MEPCIYDILHSFRQNFRSSPGRLDAEMSCATLGAIPVSQGSTLTRARAWSEERLRAKSGPAMTPGKGSRGRQSGILFKESSLSFTLYPLEREYRLPALSGQ